MENNNCKLYPTNKDKEELEKLKELLKEAEHLYSTNYIDKIQNTLKEEDKNLTDIKDTIRKLEQLYRIDSPNDTDI